MARREDNRSMIIPSLGKSMLGRGSVLGPFHSGIHKSSRRFYPDTPTSQEIEPLIITDPVLQFLFYQAGDTVLYGVGWTLAQVSRWTQDLASGRVPDGYTTLAEFEAATIATFDQGLYQRRKERLEKKRKKAEAEKAV